MKRVLHLTTVHPGQDNRIYFKYLLGLYETKKFDLYYVCPDIGVPKTDKIKTTTLRFKGSSWRSRVLRNLEAFIYCLRHKFSVIHFHDPEFLPFAICLSLLGNTMIYDVHEDYIKAFEQKKINSLAKKVIVFSLVKMEAYFDRFCTTVIAEKCYKYRFPNSIQVLNYFKDVELHNLYDPSYKFETDYNVVYTGSISPERGAYEHVDLLNFSPDINLYMIGKCSSKLVAELYSFAGSNSNRLHIVSDEVGVNFNEILKYYYNNVWLFGLALFPYSDHYYDKELTKFFEYFYFDIVPLASNFPTWARLFEEANFGFVLHRPTQFEEILKSRIKSEIRFRHKSKYTWGSELENIIEFYDAV